MPNVPIPPNEAWAGAGESLTPPPLRIAPAFDAPNGSGGGSQGKRKGFFGPVIAAVVFGFKYLKLALASGKFLLIGKSLLSMVFMIGVYAMGRGWEYASIFVALLFVHEMGHVWAARRIGLPVSAPMFIPFFGASITMKRNPKSVAHEAYMAAGGPILGTMGCMVAFTIAWVTHSPFLFHMAWIGFFLNLFNLVPVSPLDGGRIIASVSPWLWLVGAAIMVPLLIWMNAWLFLLIMVFMVGPQIRMLFQGRDHEWKVYHTCTGRQRLYASGAWLSLVCLLAFLLAISSMGARSPGNPLVGAGIFLGWPLCAVVGAVCFFTWPLREPAIMNLGRD